MKREALEYAVEYVIREFISHKWKDFLRSDENKKALFRYLAESVVSLNLPAADVSIISTLHDDVISSRRLDTEGLTNCNHEEADSRLFLHVRHAAAQGLKKVIIRTVDTDVVVLAVANVHNLQTDALWVSLVLARIRGF